jgi:chemotaxis protein MotB
MRRRRRADRVSHERWLISYSDFVTLLLAFFVVMFASQMEKKRVSQLAVAIQVAFQQMGIFDPSNSQPALATTEPMPFAAVQVVENVDRIQNMGRIVNSPREQVSESPEHSDLDKVQKDLQTGLSRQIERHTVSVTRTKEGIVVSLKEAGFFDSGSTALRPEALPTLADIVKVIGPGRMRIRIEGHTDNVRIHSVRYDSNWELSTARATEIIKLLIIRYSITPNRLSASGYGEYFPVASNLNPEGRSQNRRVDLVILNSEPSFLPPPPSVIPSAKTESPASN